MSDQQPLPDRPPLDWIAEIKKQKYAQDWMCAVQQRFADLVTSYMWDNPGGLISTQGAKYLCAAALALTLADLSTGKQAPDSTGKGLRP